MKENNIGNNKLEQLFGAITTQDPLLTEGQVWALLVNLPPVKPKSAATEFFSNRLNSVLIGISSVLIIATALLFWANRSTINIEEVLKNSSSEQAASPVLSDTVKVTQTTADTFIMIENDATAKRAKAKPVSAPVVADPVSIAAVLKYHQKKPQVFIINADKDTTLICEEGTSIEIKAHSFVTENSGNKIVGEVRINVQEYYKTPDIVLAGLSTTSGDNLLETGGMLHVEAIEEMKNA
ncbi:MAG: hypothetical protein ACK5M7_11070 [Draconibacterium sp.]